MPHSAFNQFFRFAIAGAIGFLVDASVLYLLLALGAGPYAGRLVSFLCAAFVTWQINRHFTFVQGDEGRSALREWCEYLLAMALGGLCNYSAYVASLHVLGHGAASPLIAVGVGSIVGMFVNFVSARFWVYRKASANPEN